jgi:microcystin-dependent protein
MSDFFLGEIRMFGGNYAPSQWAFCNGQTMNISQYQALFALIGTTFGGNGVQTFALPNLQGRLAVGQGQGLGLTNRLLGQSGGEENVTLLTTNLPQHIHTLNASTVNVSTSVISNTVLPGTFTAGNNFYTKNDGSTPAPIPKNLVAGSTTMTGSGQPHSNLMPTLCVSFIIALYGIFPSRN